MYLMSSSIHFFSSNMASSAAKVFKPTLIIEAGNLKKNIRNFKMKFTAESELIAVFPQ
jgi:hypothetical protein